MKRGGRSWRSAVIGAGSLALIGCQNPAVTPPPTPPRAPMLSAAERAREAVAQRDCGRAAPLLREAIGLDPDDGELHYNLAVCATHLDAHDEAVREFRWVIAHASADSPEARAAHGWLQEAGELATGRPANAGTEDENIGTSSLTGVAIWAENGEVPRPTPRLLLHLVGLEGTPTEGRYYRMRTDEQGRFAFAQVVAGPYKLTNRLAGPPMWRLKVEVKPAAHTTVSLTPENSTEVRDDFPSPEA